MKKLISIILVLVMVLSLCACGGSGEGTNGGGAAKEGLHVGYAREKILPEGQVPLGGYGNSANRISTGFLDYPYATCVAFTEGEDTVLLISTDLLRTTTAWTNEAREQINAATGIPQTNIQIAATHTHSSPDIGSNDSRIAAYKDIYMKAMVKIAQDALADQAPTTLYSTKVQTEGLNFVRHYELSDGTYGGDNFGDFTNNSIVDHATEGDPEMILVKMEREGDKKDIMLMNFQAHPCFTGGSKETNISADFIGATRDAFEKETGMNFIYFTGAAGNQNTTSRISNENHHLSMKEYGEKLTSLAVEAMPGMTKIEGDGVRCTQLMYEYKTHQEGQEKLTEAKEVSDLFSQTGDTNTANALAKQYGFHSVYHARGIVSSAGRPEKGTMELNAVYVAGLGFITAPYEMFTNTALYIKENSPFDTTIIMSMATNMVSYFPSAEAYDYGCYESFTAYFAKGCAEDSAKQLITMLESLK